MVCDAAPDGSVEFHASGEVVDAHRLRPALRERERPVFRVASRAVLEQRRAADGHRSVYLHIAGFDQLLTRIQFVRNAAEAVARRLGDIRRDQKTAPDRQRVRLRNGFFERKPHVPVYRSRAVFVSRHGVGEHGFLSVGTRPFAAPCRAVVRLVDHKRRVLRAERLPESAALEPEIRFVFPAVHHDQATEAQGIVAIDRPVRAGHDEPLRARDEFDAVVQIRPPRKGRERHFSRKARDA